MKSILQTDAEHCFLCCMNRNLEPLDKHHIFGGAYRNKSEQYGLFVYLHHCKCHIFGEDSAHKNDEISNELKKAAQIAAMRKYGWSIEDFIHIFGKNYISKAENISNDIVVI